MPEARYSEASQHRASRANLRCHSCSLVAIAYLSKEEAPQEAHYQNAEKPEARLIRMQIVEQIESGLGQLPFETNDKLADKCAHFIEQLVKWNKTYNLTAIRSADEMVGRHILDSLAIAPYIVGTDVIDVGSGAGLPGIPLAIFYPEKKFVLLDSSGKKTRFITHATIELGLSNVQIVQSRVEDYRERQFDHVVCRAFTALPNLSGKLFHLLKKDGTVLAMKGREDTTLKTDSRLQVKQTISYNVPLLAAERQLVELSPLELSR